MICVVCQDTVNIPVMLTCFPCYRKNNIHCHTFHRYCLKCVFDYLSFHVSCNERKEEVKCLFCNEKCRPPKLRFETSVEYDFLSLQNNPNLYQGRCPFCMKKEENIYQHLKECPYFYEQCDCGHVTLRQLKRFHNIHCDHFKTCFVCHERVHNLEYNDHLYEHDYVQCLACQKHVKSGELLLHRMHQCENRRIKCICCKSLVPFKNLERHLLNHLETCKETMEEVSIISNKLEHIVEMVENEIKKYFYPLVLYHKN